MEFSGRDLRNAIFRFKNSGRTLQKSVKNWKVCYISIVGMEILGIKERRLIELEINSIKYEAGYCWLDPANFIYFCEGA